MTHLSRLVLNAGALLLQARGLGRELVGHRRAAGSVGTVIRATILPGHQPDQSDAGKQGGHRVGLHRIAEVVQELTATTFGVAQCGVDHLPRRQFALQSMDDVADLGTLLIDLAFERARVFLRFQIYLIVRTHACP